MFLLKRKPSFSPSGPQSGNQGGVYFIMVTETNDDSKWNIKRWTIHNFLIKLPRTFLHLSAQKEARGVSIKVTLKKIEMEYGIDFMSKYTTLQINATLDYKRWTKSKKKTRTQIPPGGMGNGLERAY